MRIILTILLLISTSYIVGCASNPYSYQEPPDKIHKSIINKWDGDIHEKVIKTRKCWGDYCQITKRIRYLNREWADVVIVKN